MLCCIATVFKPVISSIGTRNTYLPSQFSSASPWNCCWFAGSVELSSHWFCWKMFSRGFPPLLVWALLALVLHVQYLAVTSPLLHAAADVRNRPINTVCDGGFMADIGKRRKKKCGSDRGMNHDGAGPFFMGQKAGYPRGTQLAQVTHGSWHSLLAPGWGCKVQIALSWFGCPERESPFKPQGEC